MRVSIIFRYILKNLLLSFLGVLFVLSAVFFMQRFIQIFSMAMMYGVNIGFVFSALLRITPDILCLTSPMAFQIAVLLTLTGMGENGEIMALRAAGFSFREIIRPLSAAAVILSCALFFSNNFLTPRSTKQFIDMRDNIRASIGNVVIEPKVFTEIGDWNFYAEEVDRKNNLSQVHLIKKSDSNALSTKINAEKGRLFTSENFITVELYNGQMQRSSTMDKAEIIMAHFESYRTVFPLVKKKTRSLRVGEMTTPQLYEYISRTEDKKFASEGRTEIAMRQVLMLAPLVLLFLSAPIGLNLGRRSNKTWAMLWSVVILLLFYGLMTLGISIGNKAPALGYTAPFIPVVLGLAAAAALWKIKLNK